MLPPLKAPPLIFRRTCYSLNPRFLVPCIVPPPSAIASGKRNALPLAIHRRLSSAPAPPLRILFCGSDHFSAASLRTLHQEHVSNRSLIGSIDVLCLKDQRTGRSLRTIKERETKELTVEELPEIPSGGQINLLVVVSFGLLIPARLIKAVEYGGINVHPSLLPMYRGAAPIYHTLLNQTPITGVTVQTLHHTKFDHGDILLQTNPPVNIPPKTSYQALHDTLAVHGADLLLETCRRRLFVPPIDPVSNDYKPSYAPKIDPKVLGRIDWKSQDAEEVERRCGAIGTVWTRLVTLEEPELERRIRIILSDIKVLDRPEVAPDGEEIEPGSFEYSPHARPGELTPESLIVKCKKGGGWISVGGIKIEGKRLVHAGEWARSTARQREVKAKRIFK